MFPSLQNNYADGTPQFKAGVSTALCEMSGLVGKEMTESKIIPILMDLMKDDNSEVKLNTLSGLYKVAVVVGAESILKESNLAIISNLTKDSQWRVRMEVYNLIADLGVVFGKVHF